MPQDQEGEKPSRKSRNGLPEDRFDRPAPGGRTGAHRMVARPRRFWMYFVSAVVGVALLSGLGILAVNYTGTGLSDWMKETPEETQAPPETEPKLDPEAPIVVLNGTPTPGFAGVVDKLITENGWGRIMFSGDAASNEVQISAVFYASVVDKAAALGLAEELGGVSIYQSYDYAQYGARLIVLLGADYAGPGSEQMVQASAGGAGDGAEEDAEG